MYEYSDNVAYLAREEWMVKRLRGRYALLRVDHKDGLYLTNRE